MKNFKNLTKRSLSLLLALIMCMSLLNLTVFAAENEPVLICGKEEHTHAAECYSDVLICGQDESEGHEHGDACYEPVQTLTCTVEESESHTHGEACYESRLTCEDESEEHTHGDACYSNVLICGQDESEGHAHGDACYETVQTLTCELEASEGHTHSDGCYELQLTCELEEHTHGDECYADLEIAPLNEGDPEGTNPEDTDPTCTCETNCTQATAPNADCPVCSAEGANLNTCCAGIRDLETYLGHEVTGSLWTTGDNPEDEPEQVLPDPTTGEATIEQNKTYLLKLSFNAPDGFVPGTYRYQLSQDYNLDVNANEISGDLTGTNYTGAEITIGQWSLNKNGELTLNYNEDADGCSDVSFSAGIFVTINSAATNLPFVGKITVTIAGGDQRLPGFAKSGWRDGSNCGWKIEVTGGDYNGTHYHIAGETLSDRFDSTKEGTGQQNHKLLTVESDKKVLLITMNDGVGCDDATAESESGHTESHSWYVHLGDTGFTPVVENGTGNIIGWDYTFPAEATCRHCGQTLTLEDTFTYTIVCLSTPTNPPTLGSELHKNTATIHGVTQTAKVILVYGDIGATIAKTGGTAADSNAKNWTITVELPAATKGNYRGYIIQDKAAILNPDDSVVPNTDGKLDIFGDGFTVMVNGTEAVPLAEATKENQFVYVVFPNSPSDIYLGMLKDANLTHGGNCASLKSDDGTEFCSCWTLADPATVTITYTTPADVADNLTAQYGGIGMNLRNRAQLFATLPNTGTDWAGLGLCDAKITLPRAITKTETTAPSSNNDYVATYTITLNENKANWGTNTDDQVVVTDTMNGLSYVDDTFKIIADDGSAVTHDFARTPTGFKLTLHQPGSRMFTITYDALVVNPGASYSNGADLTLHGRTYSVLPDSKNVSWASSGANAFYVTLNKTDSEDGSALAGATFKLCKYVTVTQDGEVTGEQMGPLVTTGSDGQVLFRTINSLGITFQQHVLYYLQETAAPNGYKLDDSKHYFYFCNSGVACDECAELNATVKELDAKAEAHRCAANGSTINVTNEPETGSLTIEKKLVVDGNEVTAGATTEVAMPEGYTFTITGPANVADAFKYVHTDGVTVNNDGTATVTITGAGSVTITDLLPGTYTVTEADAGIGDDYRWEMSMSVTVDPETDPVTINGYAGNVTVEDDKTTTATVTNTYTKIEPETGDLTIQKVLDGDGTDAAKGTEFHFTIQGPKDLNGAYSGVTFTDGKAEVTITGADSVTITGLPVDEYTVTEKEDGTAIAGYEWTASIDGQETASKAVKVTAGGKTDVVVTNTYTKIEPKTGDLTIQKKLVVNGATTEVATAKEYKFTITGPADVADALKNSTYTGVFTDGNGNETSDDVTFNADGMAEVTIKGAGSVTITGLPVGEYTVTEKEEGTAIDGYKWEPSGDVTVTVKADEPVTATVTNTYTKIDDPDEPDDPETEEPETKTGSLTIEKKLAGNGADAAKETKFTFTIQGPEKSQGKTYVVADSNGEVTFDDKGTATVTITGEDSLTIEGLPVDTYTVKEDNAAIEGYTWAMSIEGLGDSSEDRAVEVRVTEDGTKVVVTNTYTKTPDEPGPTPTYTYTKLTVNKEWVGDDEETRPASVKVQRYRDGKAYGSSVTLSESNGWSYTWKNLNDSYDWTVGEIDVPEGYTSSVSKNGTTVTVTNTFTQDIPEDDTPKTDIPEDPEDPPKDPEDPPKNPEDPPEVEVPDEEPPLVEIPDEEPPLVEIPDEEPPLVEIPDEEPPLVEIPDEEPPLVEIPDENPPLINWPEPVVDIPVENPPLVNWPEPVVDIPVENPPLVDWVEPTVDIPDENPPLAAAPQTGDFSGVWFAMAILSACGLAVLCLLKKRDSQEG